MWLPDAGERAYAYAKACGIIGKSFVGKRIPRLAGVSRLSELDRLVFPGSARELPERELLSDMERRFTLRAVESVKTIAECFSRPPEFLVRLVRVYEYIDLKSALAALAGDGAERRGQSAPFFHDLGRFQTVNFGAWPDLDRMIRGTEFEALPGRKEGAGQDMSVQTAIDRFYYEKLWESLFALRCEDRRQTEKILSAEISLRNASWTLRLRTYYGMQADEVREHLVAIPSGRRNSARRNSGRGNSAEDAPLELPLDSRTEWKKWRWECFLNPEEAGEWTADPRYFQNAASRHLYRMALRQLRLRPFSLDAVFCFIKLKQFEEDLLTSSAEGLGLGMSGRDVFAVMEVDE
jgi:hypothetical protein